MATDGSSIFWNRAFVDSITEQEVVGVFAHEVLHILFKHALRIRGRVHQLWNIACDYAINHILKRGGFTLPEGALFKDEYSTFTAETIYNKIRKDMSEPPEPPTKGKGDEEMMDSRLPLRVKATHRVKAISLASLVVVRLLSLKVGARLSSRRKPMVLLCPRVSTSCRG